MKSVMAALSAAALAVAFATPAWADSGLEARVAQVEQQLAAQSQPSAREIQSSVDAYLGSARADRFVNGPLVPGTRTFVFPASGPSTNAMSIACGSASTSMLNTPS